MAAQLSDILKESALPLHECLRPGPGLRITGEGVSLAPAGADGDVFVSRCEETGLEVRSTVERQGDTFVIRHELRNTAEKPSPPIGVVQPLYLEFGRPIGEWVFHHAHGGTTEGDSPPLAYTTRETFNVRWHRPLIESHEMGRSSNKDLPLLMAEVPELGGGFFIGMEWSARWYMQTEPAGAAGKGTAIFAGIPVAGLVLEPGETLELPAAHVGFFKGSDVEGTNALRRHIYENVCPLYDGEPALPAVSYDHWFGIGNDYDADLMKAEVDRAAELGVEMWVHDAAWFPGGFAAGVGNWHDTDRTKWPDGLEPLAEYVRSKGMTFGLWFEIERANHGTNAIEQHPEMFFPVTPDAEGRFAAHLNLAQKDAQDWVIETVGGWIERLDIRWSRWDYNIEPGPHWDRADPTGKIQFAYMKGLYRVLDTLIAAHPKWMVEACASGGRRIDLGTIRRAHTIWFSDETSTPYNCRYMQARANRFLPGLLCNSSVAVNRNQGDAGFDDTAVLSRMIGKLAFDGDVASWSPELTRRMAMFVQAFKDIRHLTVQDFYQLLPLPATARAWDAVQFNAHDGGDAALFVFAGVDGGCRSIQLKGLRPEATYTVTPLPDGPPADVPGEALLNEGLAVELGRSQGKLWRVRAK